MPTHSRPVLSPVQWLVLEHLVRGESSVQIAGALGIARGTVKAHINAIYRRLPLSREVNKRAAAAAWYRQHGPPAGALPAVSTPPVSGEPWAGVRPNLTPLQWRILAQLAAGSDVRAIAAGAGLTANAVQHHLKVIYARLPLGDAANRRVAAVAWYLREGCRYHGGDT